MSREHTIFGIIEHAQLDPEDEDRQIIIVMKTSGGKEGAIKKGSY